MRSRAPGPISFPFIGVAPMLRRDPFGYLTHLARTYGDVVEFRLLGRKTYLLSHPDYVREVLVTRQSSFTKSPLYRRARRLLGNGLLTSEGEHHKRQRRLLQPAFHREHLRMYADIMSDYADQACERVSADGEIDIREEMLGLTLAIVTRCLFAADVDGDAKDVCEAMSQIVSAFRVFLSPFSGFVARLPTAQNQRTEEARRRVKQIVNRIIAEHRMESGKEYDLLSTLLSLRYEDGSRLTDEQLREEVLSLFVAGHETTALALTWTWHLLAQNPDCEAKLHHELDSVLGGRKPTMADLPQLLYTERVVSEALRLYPPAWLIGRTATEPVQINDVGIETGSICVLSPYLMHRDPRFFPDPDRFDPDRWSPELRESRPKFSYFPFCGGAHVCIGERFAGLQQMLVLATFAQKWQFRMSGPPVKPVPTLTLRPSGPVRMLPVPREVLALV